MLQIDNNRHYHHHLHLALLCLIGFMIGCDNCGENKTQNLSQEEEWKPIEYVDDNTPPYSYISLLSPQYFGPSQTNSSMVQTDEVKILWDGKQIFSGELPTGKSDFDGMPVELIHIQTIPGSHILKVIHKDGQTQEVQISIQAEKRLFFKIIEYTEDGKRVLIEPLGSDPAFI